jgi:hypothetical protein
VALRVQGYLRSLPPLLSAAYNLRHFFLEIEGSVHV